MLNLHVQSPHEPVEKVEGAALNVPSRDDLDLCKVEVAGGESCIVLENAHAVVVERESKGQEHSSDELGGEDEENSFTDAEEAKGQVCDPGVVDYEG